MFRSIGRCLGLVMLLSIAISPQLYAAGKKERKSVILPDMTPELDLGKSNYDSACAACYGKNTIGTDKGLTFLHRVYHPGHHGDAAFYLAITRGVRAHHWPFGDMLPVDGITDAQIKKIILYVRALQRANGIF